MYRDLDALLEDDERKLIEDSWQARGVRHPAWTALNAYDQKRDYTRSPTDYLTNKAIASISAREDGSSWLERNKSRIVQAGNAEDCAAILAEIRCFGALLESGFEVQPIPTAKRPTPDFEFKIDDHVGVVEVATKQEDEDQIKRAELLNAGGLPDGAERSMIEGKSVRADFAVIEQHPFGAPDPTKVGDSTQTNAISRICRIKQNEKQVADGQLALLWLDFRNFGSWPGILKVGDASPLIVGHGGTVTSGPFWYGFYGWKSAPVFEEAMPGAQRIEQMQHAGRFHGEGFRSKFAAAVICLTDSTIIFENPEAEIPLPVTVRNRLTCLPWFDIAHSVVDWQPGDLRTSIKLSRSMIEHFESFVRPNC